MSICTNKGITQNCPIKTDAIGTQTAIAEKMKSRRADYMPAVKWNQKTLYNYIKDYF